MPKALFFNVPGHGHVNPSLPLVAELTRRGHQIIYFITEDYRARVEAAGAVYRPYATLRDDYFDARGLSGKVPMKVAYHLVVTTDEILPELLDAARAEQPDYILNDCACPWGLMVARILRLPAVTSLSLMPIASPPLKEVLNWEFLRLTIPIFFHDLDKGLEANRRARALAKKYNIPPLGALEFLNAYGEIGFSYTSTHFAPFASSTSKKIHFVGWTPANSTPNLEFSFERVQGRRLIYVSLGTIDNDEVGFFKTCIDTFAGDENFVILSTGRRIAPESFGTLPENVAVYAWVPQVEILKRAALFINHGGMNSVHDSLYFGVPLLLVPQQMEQTFISRRVVELGAGLMLKPSQINAQAIRENARQLLADERFKVAAQYIGDTLRSAGGVTRAGDEIEALLRDSNLTENYD